jgi:hypothetical protein
VEQDTGGPGPALDAADRLDPRGALVPAAIFLPINGLSGRQDFLVTPQARFSYCVRNKTCLARSIVRVRRY